MKKRTWLHYFRFPARREASDELRGDQKTSSTGSRRAIATAQDERILNERRRHHDAPFDACPVSRATLADLDVRRFEEDYLPRAFDPELLAANDRSTEERLAATRMIASVDEPVPTVVGMLVFGRSPRDFIPGAYIQFLRMGGTEFPGPVLDEARCTGPISTQLERLFGKLDSHNRTAVDITSGPVEERRSTHSAVALRQIAYNAVMHRTYGGHQRAHPGHLVRRPGGDHESGRSVRCGHGRELRPAGSGRLPESEPGRVHARPRSGPAIRRRHRDRPGGPAAKRPAGTVLRCAAQLGAMRAEGQTGWWRGGSVSEGRRIEWRTAWCDGHLRSVCAFANAGGGTRSAPSRSPPSEWPDE